MVKTIILFIAVFLFIFGIIGLINKIVDTILNGHKNTLLFNLIVITIGLTYIIWYCN
jgi:hypothetical protein